MILVYAATIFLSAFLLFLVQPIIGKQVLPWFGGSAGVWTMCLAFFQTVLLAGYAYSDWLVRRGARTQAIVHLALLSAAVLTLPILARTVFKPTGAEDPTIQILILLVATVGAPYFLLSSTGPLLQAWTARALAYKRGHDAQRQTRVYRLFALSNFASLLALLAYPFAVEPHFTVPLQAWIWSGAFVLFAIMCGACALLALRAEPADLLDTPAADAPGQVVGVGAAPGSLSYVLWLCLSALGCVMLLAVTTHITQNVASVPFLWLAPLCLYLLTFILCFEGRIWYQRWLFYPLLIALVPLMAWGLSKDSAVLSFRYAVPLYCSGLFVLCMFCHGELARAKPAAAYLTRFYLLVSLGGALGGLSVGLAAPQLFSGYWELPLALIAAGALLWAVNAKEAWISPLLAAIVFAAGLWALLASPPAWFAVDDVRRVIGVVGGGALVLSALAYVLHRSPRALAAGLGLMAAVSASVLFNTYLDTLKTGTVQMSRNFYGVVRVRESSDKSERKLAHGVILHGTQFTDPAKQRIPTTYYAETSGAGLAMKYLRARLQRPLRVAVIGLGTGTMAAYAQSGDFFRFYEINPQVIALARKDFTYLAGGSKAGADVDTVLGDARLVLEAQPPQQFDLLVVDAFTSDAIPVHLVTREAMVAYKRHMAAGGIVAFHVSNRYLNLQPVVKQLADSQNMHAMWISNDRDEAHLSKTDYVLVTQDVRTPTQPPFAGNMRPIEIKPGMRVWTDDYNNLFDVFKW